MDRQSLGRIYDFALLIVTVILFSMLGIVCLYGTLWSFNKSLDFPQWAQTYEYLAYLGKMNALAMPLTLILLLTMALCIPKRIIPRHLLFPVGIGILLASSVIAIAISPLTAITLTITFSALVQMFVTFSVMRSANYVVFEKTGNIEKIGSSFLHLGFLIFTLDLVVLQDSYYHLSIFWISTALITIGCIFIFYPQLFQQD